MCNRGYFVALVHNVLLPAIGLPMSFATLEDPPHDMLPYYLYSTPAVA